MRLRAAACLTVLVVTTLSGCGTSSYCTAVESNRPAIDDATLTTASFTSLGEALRAIETDAPSDVRDDYTAVADADGRTSRIVSKWIKEIIVRLSDARR